MSGGPKGSVSLGVFVKVLDELLAAMYCQVTLPPSRKEEQDVNEHA
jgi:hypothetical protein